MPDQTDENCDGASSIESVPSKSREKIKIGAISMLTLLMPLALFYLLILPMIVASNPGKAGAFGIAFATFLLIQTFALSFEFAYTSFAEFYNLRRKRLFNFPGRLNEQAALQKVGVAAIPIAFISFLQMNYSFAILYEFLSNVLTDAFSVDELSIFDAIYFAFLAGTGSAPGDILPQHWIVKSVSMLQTFSNFAFAIFLFSISSSYLRERRAAEMSDAGN